MPLKIVITGAGLGGLGAAIALNRAGHAVTVLEKSSFLNEVGAAIHVAPNATRILKAWGVDLASLQPVRCERLVIWDAKEERVLKIAAFTEELQKALGVSDEWLLTHRVDLHGALREAAMREVDGRGVDIRLGVRVVEVNAEAGEVLLEDGTKYTADLVVGADGIHSRTVKSIPNLNTNRISTGQNCFRFLVPVEKMQSNPLTASLLSRITLDGLHVFTTHDRRFIMYPCRGGSLLNVGAICPSSPETEADGKDGDSSWHNAGTVKQLLDTFNEFSADLRELCGIAEDVKLWSLASRDPAPTFVHGRLAVLGDAAHPMLPHQGQGAAQALEDAAALGALLTADTTAEQLPKRLNLYNKLRFRHAVTLMMMSRTSDDRREEMLGELQRFVPGAECPGDMFGFSWLSDPVKEAGDMLRGSS